MLLVLICLFFGFAYCVILAFAFGFEVYTTNGRYLGTLVRAVEGHFFKFNVLAEWYFVPARSSETHPRLILLKNQRFGRALIESKRLNDTDVPDK